MNESVAGDTVAAMFIEEPSTDDERVRARYEEMRSEMGYVMNYARAWGWVPDVELAFRQARMKLDETTALSPRERATIVVASVATLEDAGCSLAWGKKLAGLTDADTATAVVTGSDSTTMTARERALARWARDVVADPNRTTREDVAALRTAGFSEREIVEATVLVAFRVAFAMVNDALGVVVDRQLVEGAPDGVRNAVTFGRRP